MQYNFNRVILSVVYFLSIRVQTALGLNGTSEKDQKFYPCKKYVP